MSLWIAALSTYWLQPLKLLSSTSLMRVHFVSCTFINGDNSQYWSPYWSLRDTSAYLLPVGLPSTDGDFLRLVPQPILYPPCCPLIQPVSHQFVEKTTGRLCQKPYESQGILHPLTLPRPQSQSPPPSSDEVSQLSFALGKLRLAAPNHLLAFHPYKWFLSKFGP